MQAFQGRKIVTAWLGIVALLLSINAAVHAAAANKKIVVIFADFSERMGLFFVAKDQRLFEEQGVDVELVQVRSGPIAISALAANEAQFYTVSATGASLGAMAGASTSRSSRGLLTSWMAISRLRRRSAARRS